MVFKSNQLTKIFTYDYFIKLSKLPVINRGNDKKQSTPCRYPSMINHSMCIACKLHLQGKIIIQKRLIVLYTHTFGYLFNNWIQEEEEEEEFSK